MGEMGEEIDQLRAENARLREWKTDVENSQRIVLEEKCAPDEKHCGCVPILRQELARLREALDRLVAAEREECAKLAENAPEANRVDIAAAIRAR
jgi:hypothetical protein